MRQLDREEFKLIARFKTLTKGLNRCKIIIYANLRVYGQQNAKVSEKIRNLGSAPAARRCLVLRV